MELSALVRNICTSLVCCLLLGEATFVQAYPTPVDFNGKALRWPFEVAPYLSFRIQIDSGQSINLIEEIIEDSARMWSQPTSSRADLQRTWDENEEILIIIQDQLSDAPHSAGYSIFDQYGAEGPEHCSIYVARDRSWTNFAKTILHEIGHCLGLGHSTFAESIMSYELNSNRYALSVDDVAAISRLYPIGGEQPFLAPGCSIGSFGATPQSADGGYSANQWWVAVFAMILPMFVALLLAATIQRRNQQKPVASEEP